MDNERHALKGKIKAGATSDPASVTSDLMDKKPRVKWCWWCGNKLRGNHHIEKMVCGHIRILHKECEDMPPWKLQD